MSPSVPTSSGPDEQELVRVEQLQLVALCLACAIANLLLRLAYLGELETSRLLFIGIPTLLAVLLALTPRARSVVVSVMKWITLGLLMSATLLGEVFVFFLVYFLVAIPLCYIVGAIVAIAVRWSSRRPAVR